MSIATKRRFVRNQVEREYYEPSKDDTFALVTATRGNNLHEVIDEHDKTYLVSMPQKFRKSVWVKRDQFVVVQPIEEGDKVKAEIQYVLDNDNVAYLIEQGKWPKRFEKQAESIAGVKPTNAEEPYVDEDLLPPSSSEDGESGDDDDNSEDEEDSLADEAETSDDDDNGQTTANPNKRQAPN